jgi:DNA-binding MarR family transcriptional regulator
MMIGMQIIGIPIIGMRMIDPEFYAMTIEMRMLHGTLGKIARDEIERRLTSLDAGVSAMQFFLMQMLSREEQTMTEVSRKMMVDPSTLVPMVDALERKGFVMRGKDPNDRRRIPLSLTEKARTLLSSIPPVDENDIMLNSLHRMGYDKATQLIELSRELVKNLPNGEALLSEMMSKAASYGSHCKHISSTKSEDPPR